MLTSVLAVDDKHFQPRLFQHFVGTEPIDASGFHRHGMDAVGSEPVAQAWSCPVVVPNTWGVSPAMETWSLSLPTSMAAALGSRTGRAFMRDSYWC